MSRSIVEGVVSDDAQYVAREAFTSPDIYALEKQAIFRRNWLFLAHESQIAKTGDFITTTMAETPIIVLRDRTENIRAYVNTCSHRGLPVCRADAGNARGFMCPYHGWTYDLDGKLTAVPQERLAGRIDKSPLGLPPVPRIESYRGFFFGNFDPEAPSLETHLGDMRFYLDVYLDRFNGGVSVIGPPQKWALSANWKIPYENQLGDLGHANFLHAGLAGPDGAFNESERFGMTVVTEPGHSAAIRLMPETSSTEERAWGIEGVSVGMDLELRAYLIAIQKDAEARLGALKSRIKGLVCGVYPNFNLVWSNHSIRVSHPRGPSATELWSWWIAPAVATDAVKAALRQQYNFVLGPAGIVEQEDSEAWNQQLIGSRADYLEDRPYFYGLGLGQEGRHPELPGIAGAAANEHYARAFYLRWRKELTAESTCKR